MKCSPLVNRNNSQESAGIKKKIPGDPQSQQTPPASPGDQIDRGQLIFITEVAAAAAAPGGGGEREAQSVMLLHCEE